MKITKLNIKDLYPDPYQPRKHFDQEKIKELASSIEEKGLISPVLVRKEKDKYVIIAGERRYRALKYLNRQTIDAIVTDRDDYREVALIENIQREDLNPVEEARAIEKLINTKGYTHQEVGKLIGKSRSYITNKLRLLNLDEDSLKMIEEGKITPSHGRTLLALEDQRKRKELATKILKEGLSVRKVEKKSTKNKTMTQEEEYALELLEESLETKVHLDVNEGKITIEYYSNEQLAHIVNKIIK